MEDSLLQDHFKVREHIQKDFPKEICGVLAGKKNLSYYPCTNIAEDVDEFIIHPKEYTRLSLTKNIAAIVHSHNGSSTPSEWDISQCNAIGLPFVIYGTEDVTVLQPEKHRLKGRIYEFGVQDCFEAVRDWYLFKGIWFPPRHKWIEDWDEKGLNYFEDLIPEWGFKKVEDNSLQYGDLITFKVFSKVPDHIGVYEDRDNFFHHANGRTSCSENLWSFWAKFMVGVYRHEKTCNIGG